METKANQEYYAKRQLKKGTAGWFLLAGLGVFCGKLNFVSVG
ncbi:hypothetical protein [Thiomicrorhabdus hydrogeniphila]